MSDTQILAVLGEAVPRGTAVSGRLALADLISKGLRQSTLERVKRELGLSDVQIGSALGMSLKTISRMRKKPEATLSVVPSDRLYRLAALYSLAREVFGDRQAARDWLQTPAFGLGNRVPLELMNTEVGAREVENLLGRIEHGVLS